MFELIACCIVFRYEEEFRAAHAGKRKGIIVVVLGDLPTEQEMGPLMWQYVKSNTYLKHDDPWFWDKLRYALPHRGRVGRANNGAFKSSSNSSSVRRGLPKWKRGRTDQLQLLEKGKVAAAGGSNGQVSAVSSAPLTEDAGRENPSFMGSSTLFVAQSPPGSAEANGHVVAVPM